MTPEMIAILGVGAANLAAVTSMTGVLVTLMLRQNLRIDRLEQGFEQRFDQMEERMQRLEQGQAGLEGELAIIREVLFAHPAAGD